MINLGLSAADHTAFEATLKQSHRIRTIVHIHDQNERIFTTFNASVISGSIQVDASQAGATRRVTKDRHHKPAQSQPDPSGPVRTLELTCLRPNRDPVWQPNTPGGETVFANNFVSVLYGVWVDGLSDGPGWVDVPVFWGPVTGIDQDGEQITIHGSGKEVLALDPCLLWDTVKVPAGRRRGQGIKDLLSANGEARYKFEEVTDRLTAHWIEGRYSQPWVASMKMARAGNLQLFYDGLGRAVVRQWPKNRVWSFTDGDNGTLLSRPTVSYDISTARNTIEVIGTAPKGAKTNTRVVAWAPASNPLSPSALSRNGERRWMVYSEQHNSSNLTTVTNIADELLFEMLTAQVDVQFDAMVIPHLEEGDRIAVVYNGHPVEFTLDQFTIPLASTDTMSIGVNRRINWRQRAKHRDIHVVTAPVRSGRPKRHRHRLHPG